jgi:hypothetical protein
VKHTLTAPGCLLELSSCPAYPVPLLDVQGELSVLAPETLLEFVQQGLTRAQDELERHATREALCCVWERRLIRRSRWPRPFSRGQWAFIRTCSRRIAFDQFGADLEVGP